MHIDEDKIAQLASQLRPIDIMTEMFRKGDFSFIVEGYDDFGNKVSHEKQREALEILTCGKYDEFLYGGAAGGAKTWTGCVWIMFTLLCYPETKAFIGRNELKDILDSVKVTFDKVAKTYGFDDYKFNAQKNYITYGNGSHINLIEVKYKPSDPMYEDVGSTEYTIGWGEEIGEWHETAATVLASRVGRHLNTKDEKGNLRKKPIKGTVLWTCNPKNNWGKREFHDKAKNGTLEENKAYLQCLITENPFIEKEYVEKLRKIGKKNKSLYERLFMGNWDYEDNPNQLAEQEMIDNIFNNDQVKEGKTYLTVDAARYGSDKAVIIAWEGWRAVEIITYDISSTQELIGAVMYLRKKYRIPTTRAIGDDDGVGGGLNDLTGIRRFKNGARCIRRGKDAPNYKNIQVQCLFLLAERINEGDIWVNADITEKQKAEIKEELSQIQRVPNKRDETKLDCKSKGEIRTDIGRSPDYRDALLMRVWFELNEARLNLTTKWN